jgi:hypothetical protein
VSGAEPLLDRPAIEDAFRRLGDRLVRRGVVADIYVFGGAAMALAYDARRATRDIDAVFEPHDWCWKTRLRSMPPIKTLGNSRHAAQSAWAAPGRRRR